MLSYQTSGERTLHEALMKSLMTPGVVTFAKNNMGILIMTNLQSTENAAAVKSEVVFDDLSVYTSNGTRVTFGLKLS